MNAVNTDIPALSLDAGVPPAPPEPLHTADQCDAYRTLADAGRTTGEIAATYGTSEQTVIRCLKLARVSPRLVDLFRADGIRADQMMALAVSDCHEEQERAWFDATSEFQRHPELLRRRLVANEDDFRSNHVSLFVGIDAYEAAGGTVRRDLFSDKGAAWYADHVLMVKVALEQLAQEAERLRAEGWDWVESILTFDQAARADFVKVPPTALPPSAAQQAEMDAIDQRMKAINAAIVSKDTGQRRFERLVDEKAVLATRYAEIEGCLQVYLPSQKVGAGAIVTITMNGTLDIQRGWIKRSAVRNSADANTPSRSTR